MNVNGGHFLKEDIAAWDAPFFSITPNEANSMDPQQRILLENAYRALENGMMASALTVHCRQGNY
jgi:acyl transferase domain-containing protein